MLCALLILSSLFFVWINGTMEVTKHCVEVEVNSTSPVLLCSDFDPAVQLSCREAHKSTHETQTCLTWFWDSTMVADSEFRYVSLQKFRLPSPNDTHHISVRLTLTTHLSNSILRYTTGLPIVQVKFVRLFHAL